MTASRSPAGVSSTSVDRGLALCAVRGSKGQIPGKKSPFSCFDYKVNDRLVILARKLICYSIASAGS